MSMGNGKPTKIGPYFLRNKGRPRNEQATVIVRRRACCPLKNDGRGLCRSNRCGLSRASNQYAYTKAADRVLRKAVRTISLMTCLGGALGTPANASAASSPTIAQAPGQPVAPKPSQASPVPLKGKVYGTLKLSPVVTTAARYGPLISLGEKMLLTDYYQSNLDLGWPRWPHVAAVVTPNRFMQRVETVGASVHLIPSSELSKISHTTLCEVLTAGPEIELPGDAVGPSAALDSREVRIRGMSAAVVVDGIPFNDPFDGSADLSTLPFESIGRVEIVAGGGAMAWGNGAVGGAIQLFTVPAKGRLVTVPAKPNDGGPPDPRLTKKVVRTATIVSLTAGEFGTHGADLVSSLPTAKGVFQVISRIASTNGFLRPQPEDRGPIDQPAWRRSQTYQVRWSRLLRANFELTAALRDIKTSHGEGTPGQRGDRHRQLASVFLANSQNYDFAWNASAYVQRNTGSNTFTAVNSARDAESPLIDVTGLPVSALGATWTGQWWRSASSRTIVGADLHWVRGEVRETLNSPSSNLALNYVAGGTQSQAGIFVLQDQPLGRKSHVTFGIRCDALGDSDGYQRWYRSSDSVLLNDTRNPSGAGIEFCPGISFTWQPHPRWLLRCHAQEAYRRPTLAERYVVLGQDDTIVEPNPNLTTEHATNIDIGVEFQPTKSIVLTASAFVHQLRDFTGTTIAAREGGHSTQFLPPPPSYLELRRINLDRGRIEGLSLSAAWNPIATLSFDGSVLLSNPRIGRVDAAPSLTGNRPVGLPQQTATFSGYWRAEGHFTVWCRLRYTGQRFADDANTLPLAWSAVVDLGISRAVTPDMTVFLDIWNLGNTRIQFDRNADGTIFIDQPRLVVGGLRIRW